MHTDRRSEKKAGNESEKFTVCGLFWLRPVTIDELAEEVAHDHVCLLRNRFRCRVLNFLKSTEKVSWAPRQKRITIVQFGENKGTDERLVLLQ